MTLMGTLMILMGTLGTLMTLIPASSRMMLIALISSPPLHSFSEGWVGWISVISDLRKGQIRYEEYRRYNLGGDA